MSDWGDFEQTGEPDTEVKDNWADDGFGAFDEPPAKEEKESSGVSSNAIDKELKEFMEESSDEEVPPYTKEDLIKESESDEDVVKEEETWAGFEEPEN